LATQIALHIAMRHEIVVVFFVPDGGREATAIRIGGLLGLDQDKLEDRAQDEIAKLADLLHKQRIFIVDDSRDDVSFKRIREDAEKVRPDLPHLYILDSAQECVAEPGMETIDERHQVMRLARAAWDCVVGNPIPSLVITTSQVAGASFGPKRSGDRTNPLA